MSVNLHRHISSVEAIKILEKAVNSVSSRLLYGLVEIKVFLIYKSNKTTTI